MTSTVAGPTVRDYDRALAVLDRCVDAETLEGLQADLLEALGSVYGCRHSAFFRTTAFTRTFADPSPVMNGRIPRVIDEYRERWFSRDVMFTVDSITRIRHTGVSALAQLEPRRIPDSARTYLDRFFFRSGLYSVCALDLDLPGGQRGVVGLFHDGDDGLDGGDLAGLRVVVRQLSAVTRRLPSRPAGRADAVPTPLDALPPRLREIAGLVGEGAPNAAIARRTGLTVDTVKKYVSQVLDRTGCANRTELALLTAGRAR
jgi:DNA-binding CsgD family transcriptional regulator